MAGKTGGCDKIMIQRCRVGRYFEHFYAGVTDDRMQEAKEKLLCIKKVLNGMNVSEYKQLTA
jgi:hypothetical protein